MGCLSGHPIFEESARKEVLNLADLISYLCPCCGGKIEYNSTVQEMKCPFCETVFDLETLASYDSALSEQPAESNTGWDEDAGSQWEQGETEGMRIYKCQACGGEVIGDETTGASRCPYCDAPVIMTGQFSGDLKPDLVIPFQLDKEAAKKALLRHMEGKKLLPKVFRSENHIDEIKGIYVPVWLFETDADAHFQYRAKKVRTWSDQQFMYTETSYFNVTRAGKIAFANVPVDGSQKMDDKLMESLEPFDIAKAVDFKTAFLSGYLADRYDVDADASKQRASERIQASIRQEFAKTVQGYSGFEQERESMNFRGGKTKYALYPVWILNTTWNGNQYTFAMNGQSGKFVGDLPADKAKSWRYFFIAAAVTTVIAYIIGSMF